MGSTFIFCTKCIFILLFIYFLLLVTSEFCFRVSGLQVSFESIQWSDVDISATTLDPFRAYKHFYLFIFFFLLVSIYQPPPIEALTEQEKYWSSAEIYLSMFKSFEFTMSKINLKKMNYIAINFWNT